MKTESMAKETIFNELKDYESEKKMTDEELANIKGGCNKIKDLDFIVDDLTPL